MRKILFLITFLPLWLVGSVGYAQGGADDPLKFKVTVTDPESTDHDGNLGNGNHPKSDPVLPSVCLANHTLLLYGGCDGTTLRVVDMNSNVVYSTYIAAGTTQVVLPSTLSGTFELQIIRGQYLFYTEIDL